MPKMTTYTVRDGDSLSSIALVCLGCARKWQDIYSLNREVIGPDPDILKPGMVLRILRPQRGATTMQREDVDRMDWKAAWYALDADARALLDRAEKAEAERDAAFAAGQEDMRERANLRLALWAPRRVILAIRDLPIKPRPE